MSKQINFYATEDDKAMIADILNNVFEQLIDVPYYKANFTAFDKWANKRKFYLAEESRKKDVSYRIHEYSDTTTAELLDYRKSPVLEYFISFKNIEKEFCEGRFYCCSDDSDFSKKVSKFFAKFKKEFKYVKKYMVYISPNIDLFTAKFGNKKIITKEDLS